jgi:hypothetical protein
MPLMIFYLCARTLIYVYMFGGYCSCLLKYSWSPWPCPVSEGLACHYKLLLGLAAERGSTVALYEHYLQKPGLLSTLCQEMESHTRRMWVFASGRRGDNNRGFCSASSKWCLCCRLRRECLWVLTDDAWFYLLTNRWHTSRLSRVSAVLIQCFSAVTAVLWLVKRLYVPAVFYSVRAFWLRDGRYVDDLTVRKPQCVL